ncbi:transposable element Tcb1 transposase [Trichonephila clavipes]|nr:transposable element Tcb1 transposase [Trichonephila clavipes]
MFMTSCNSLPLMQCLFQQGNARTHTARVSQVCLRTVTTLPRPAPSPDHPMSLNELEARLQQLWNDMSQDIIQNLYASMPDRIALCIRAKGGLTEYKILRSFAFFSEINNPFSLIF